MQLEDIMLNEVRQAQKNKGLDILYHTRKMGPKDKHIEKNKHDHIQTQM
jgi:hypothetical protein